MPLLKWPGGKRRLLSSILPVVPFKFGTYYEPFLGGGALFFALQPGRAILADQNPDLICTYLQIKYHPEAVLGSLKKLKNSEREYYLIRQWTPEKACDKAARLIYLSALSFNGIHRVNLRGVFNVPYGKKLHLNPCDPDKIRAANRALRNAIVRCEDFEVTLQSAKKGDFVYLDPPYTTAHSNNGFVKYNARIFTWEDQKRLSAIARDLVKRAAL
jgi:DNA adenine methylase